MQHSGLAYPAEYSVIFSVVFSNMVIKSTRVVITLSSLLQVQTGPLPECNAQLHNDSAKQAEPPQTEAQAKVSQTIRPPLTFFIRYLDRFPSGSLCGIICCAVC